MLIILCVFSDIHGPAIRTERWTTVETFIKMHKMKFVVRTSYYQRAFEYTRIYSNDTLQQQKSRPLMIAISQREPRLKDLSRTLTSNLGRH